MLLSTLEGRCECAVFDTATPEKRAVPLLSQSLLNTTCNATGQEQCHGLCTYLAQAARERGPGLLCSSIGHAVKLRVRFYLYSVN